MRTLNVLSSCLRLILIGVVLAAVTVSAQEAKILKIVGNAAAVSVSGATGPVLAGMSLPVNARLTTGAGVEVYIEAVTGVVATIKANSEISVASLGSAANRTLDLRRGSVVSQVDASRYKKDTYGVKTPRGVAAARGTTYTTSVNGQAYTIFTLAGVVTVTPVGGGPESAITISAGGISISDINGGAVMTPAQISANPTASATAIQAAAMALAAVAYVASDPDTFGSASAAARRELLQVMATLVQQLPQAIPQAVASGSRAAPSQASAIVAAAIAAAGPANAIQVAQSVAQAAAQGAASTTNSASAAAALAQAIAQSAASAAAAAAPGDATGLATSISQAAALGAVQGAMQAGLDANSVGTAIANGAAQGAAQGASMVVPAQASNIAAGAANGAAQGARAAGSTNLDAAAIAGAAAAGATSGSGASIPPPPPPVLRAPPSAPPALTPVTPIDPTITVSPSN